MNRPTKTALRIAGIALALSGLGGVLTGCGGSDGASPSSDGASADETSGAGSMVDFCEKLTGLAAAVGQADPKDPTAAVKGLKEWVGEMEDIGTPGELTGEARAGYEVLIGAFKDVDDDATLEELQKVGSDVSAADQKKVETFSAWNTENCSTPAAPSDDAS